MVSPKGNKKGIDEIVLFSSNAEVGLNAPWFDGLFRHNKEPNKVLEWIGRLFNPSPNPKTDDGVRCEFQRELSEIIVKLKKKHPELWEGEGKEELTDILTESERDELYEAAERCVEIGALKFFVAGSALNSVLAGSIFDEAIGLKKYSITGLGSGFFGSGCEKQLEDKGFINYLTGASSAVEGTRTLLSVAMQGLHHRGFAKIGSADEHLSMNRVEGVKSNLSGMIKDVNRSYSFVHSLTYEGKCKDREGVNSLVNDVLSRGNVSACLVTSSDEQDIVNNRIGYTNRLRCADRVMGNHKEFAFLLEEDKTSLKKIADAVKDEILLKNPDALINKDSGEISLVKEDRYKFMPLDRSFKHKSQNEKGLEKAYEQRIENFGKPHAFVTCGKMGALYITEDEIIRVTAEAMILEQDSGYLYNISPKEIDWINEMESDKKTIRYASGAGDTANGIFDKAVMAGLNVRDALRFSMAMAQEAMKTPMPYPSEEEAEKVVNEFFSKRLRVRKEQIEQYDMVSLIEMANSMEVESGVVTDAQFRHGPQSVVSASNDFLSVS